MRKILLTFLVTAFATSMAHAAGTTDAETTAPVESTNVVELLNSVEGYIFLTPGEQYSRDLRNTFTRTDEVFSGEGVASLARMSWRVFNDEIAEVSDEGIIVGKSFGNTMLRVTDLDNVNHYFIVFVTPTITVVTPEGAVYTHQKIYNDKAHIKISQSREYIINCVMLKGEESAEAEDITIKEDVFIMHETENDGYGYGEYISEKEVTNNFTLTVTLEERRTNNVTGYRVQVDGMVVKIVKKSDGSPVGGKPVTITSVNGNVVYAGKFPESGELQFNPDVTGVYFLSFDNEPYQGTFKFMTRNVQAKQNNL